MRVLFIDSVHSVLKNHLHNLGFHCHMAEHMNRKEILSIIKNYEGLVVRSKTPIDKEFFKSANKLKFIARSGAGLENIDLKEAKKKGVDIFSAPEGNKQAVGEHTLGMILALFNKLLTADREIRKGKWNRETNRGLELNGKIVGIIGYGNMGKSFAKCLSGFDCTVLAYDSLKQNISDKFVTESSLKNIQKNADIISFHTPYNKSTHHYFNEQFITAMEKPFYLINTARGKIIKTVALNKGLKSKKILGACLDVLEFEKSSFENIFDRKMPNSFKILLNSKNVILSPHVAGWTIESYKKLSLVLAKKIEKKYFKVN